MHRNNLEAGESQKMQVRVAVNVGEVRLSRGDVFGEPVNVASRLESITPAGEIWFTEATYLAMTRSEVPAEKVGEHTFKGIDEPVVVWRVAKGSSHRLEASGDAGQDAAALPYGGLGLQRYEASRGIRLSKIASNIANGPARLLELARAAAYGIPAGARKLGVAFAVIAGLVAVILAAWPRDMFADVWQALDEKHTRRALRLIRNHPKRFTPEGMAVEAVVLLGLPKPRIEKARVLLEEAIRQEPDLLDEERFLRGLVLCLDQPEPQRAMELLARSRRAIPALLEASRSERYWLRWNSIKLLERFGMLDKVDLGLAYIMDLEYAGSCSTRKRAARELAKLKDKRALPALRKAQQRSFFENLCMGDTLEESIRAIEGKK
ncbi:MAG: hypothetical protein D6806_16555 [Deltaproteobacteria bacterium]|nr:MAG: hypothetical protein D6806_16555 [Deltaproteobacteria bacterium]